MRYGLLLSVVIVPLLMYASPLTVAFSRDCGILMQIRES